MLMLLIKIKTSRKNFKKPNTMIFYKNYPKKKKTIETKIEKIKKTK